MKSTLSLFFTVNQTVADTDISKQVFTTLIDANPQVLRVLGVEFYWPSMYLIGAVNALLNVKLVFGNRVGVELQQQLYIRAGGSSPPHHIMWTPPTGVDVLIPHEYFTVTNNTVATGVINALTLRMYYDKLSVTPTEKLAMLSIK